MTIQFGDGEPIETSVEHMSKAADALSNRAIGGDQLKAFIERVERLEEEKAGIAGDIKEIYAEAKGSGFNASVMRKIVAMRRRDPNERSEEEAIADLYLEALGMQGRLF